MMNRYLLGAIILFSQYAGTLQAETPLSVSFSKEQGTVEFKGTGKPGSFKVIGKGEGFDGEFKIVNHSLSGKASFDLTTLHTGIKLRDRHMKEKYLETDKFPKAVLVLEQVSFPWSEEEILSKNHELPIKGNLTVHGVTVPVSMTMNIYPQLNTVTQMTLKLSDFQIERPSFTGVKLNDEVEVTLNSPATLKPSGKAK